MTKDYFSNQCRHFFNTKQGEQIKSQNITTESIEAHLRFLIDQINILSEQNFFTKYEEAVKNIITRDFKDSLFYLLVGKVALLNSQEKLYIRHDKDIREKAFQKLKQELVRLGIIDNSNYHMYIKHYLDNKFDKDFYYTYRNVGCLLSIAKDIIEYEDIGYNIPVIVEIVKFYRTFPNSIQNGEIQEIIDQLEYVQNSIIGEFNNSDRYGDSKIYFWAIETFASVFEYYSKIPTQNAPVNFLSVLEFIKSEALSKDIELFINSKYSNIKNKLYIHLKNEFENQIIELCGKYLLIQEEGRIIQKNNKLREEYDEEYTDYEENPDSRECDYGGQLKPSEPAYIEFNPEDSQYSHEVFMNPNNITLLMQYLDQRYNNSEIVLEKCEYVIDTTMELLKEITNNLQDLRAQSLEPSILRACMYSLLFYHKFPNILNDRQFIAPTYLKSLKQLTIDASGIEKIRKTVSINYIRGPEILNKLPSTIDEEFNQAMDKEHYLKAQRIWYTFCKYTFFINAFLDYSPQMNNITQSEKALDAVLKKIGNISDSYDNIAAKYNVVCPTSSSTTIYYQVKNCKVELNLRQCFKELGGITHNIKNAILSISDKYLTKHPENIKSINIVAGALYFLVNKSCGVDNLDYEKLFIKVPIYSDKYANKLLSQDPTDGVNTKNDNLTECIYSDVRNYAKDLHHYGKCLINENYPTDIAYDYRDEALKDEDCKLYHSEPLMALFLQDRGNIENIVNALAKNLCKETKTLQLQGKHTVHLSLLVTYSTNATCDSCIIKLIGNQYKYPEGFTSKLEERLNNHDHFTTKNYEGDNNSFNLVTIIGAGKAYSTQTKDLEKIQSHYGTIAKGIAKDEINLESPYDQEYGRLHLPEGLSLNTFSNNFASNYLIEYIIPIEYIMPKSLLEKNIVYNSIAFMSGSKDAKFSTTENESFVEQINNHINSLYLSGATAE